MSASKSRSRAALGVAIDAGVIRGSGAAQELGDDLAGLLAALDGDPLEALGVVALDADEYRQPRVGVALVHLDLVRPGAVELGVEVAGLGIRVCPGVFAHIN